MIALSHKAAALLLSLRESAEGVTETRPDGSEWRNVYIDNARPHEMTPRQFRWHLSSLAKAGLYKSIDGYAWGDVRINGWPEK